MNKDRLLTLANWLDRVDPERFCMSTWASKHECGTTACAMGHACDVPEFKALGLKLMWNQTAGVSFDTAHVVFPDSNGGAARIDMSAAKALFDINDTQAEYLFASETEAGEHRGDETPQIVAERIRGLVADPLYIPDSYFADDYDDTYWYEDPPESVQ